MAFYYSASTIACQPNITKYVISCTNQENQDIHDLCYLKLETSRQKEKVQQSSPVAVAATAVLAAVVVEVPVEEEAAGTVEFRVNPVEVAEAVDVAAS